MRPTARQMEERLAWRSLAAVVMPALLLLPFLAAQRTANGTSARDEAPLFTLTDEPAPRARAVPPLPAEPVAAPPTPRLAACVLPPKPQLQEIGSLLCGLDFPSGEEPELTVDSLPAPRRAAQRPMASATTAPATTPPAYLSNPKPPYPAAMRQRRIQGSVGVRIAVSPQGLPTAVDITRPSGHAEFDSTTRSWIMRHWRFRPATSAGRAAASSVATTVRFRLD